MKNKKIIPITTTLVIALFLSACKTDIPDEQIDQAESIEVSGLIAEGSFEPNPSAKLAFGISGVISDIFLEEGENVTKGDPIARLSSCGPLESDLAAAQTDLLAAQIELDDLELYAGFESATALQELINAQEIYDEAQLDWDDFDEDAYQDDLGEAQEDVQEAQEDLDEAIADLEDYLDLEEDNATRQRYQDDVDDAERALHVEQQDLHEVENDFLQAKQEFELAASQLATAKEEYNKKSEGSDTDQFSLLQNRIDTLESTIEGIEEHLNSCQVTAQFNGTLLRNDLKVGEFAQAGAPALLIADTSEWILKTNDVSEYEVVNIQVGQNVEVTADAIPDFPMEGTVIEIDKTATLDHGDVTYTITIILNETPPELQWGMTGSVRFLPAE